jgi:hypothetical protein
MKQEIKVEDALAPKRLVFKVDMLCPRLFDITPDDIKRILDSETEQVVTRVELLQEALNGIAT